MTDDSFTRCHYTQLVPNPINVRRRIPQDNAFLALAASIKEHGIVEALIGVPMPDGTIMLISGHRRRAAIAYLVEQGELPADHAHCTAPIRVEVMDADRQRELIFIANEHREPLNPVEEGLFYQSLHDQGWPKSRIAHRLSVSGPRVDNRLLIASFCEDMQAMYADGRLPLLSASHFAAIADEHDRLRLARLLAGRNLPIGRIETLAAQVAEHGMDALLDKARPEYSKATSRKSGGQARTLPASERIGLAAIQTAAIATCRGCDAVPTVALPAEITGAVVNAVSEQVCTTCPVRDIADACAVCPLVDFLARLGARSNGDRS